MVPASNASAIIGRAKPIARCRRGVGSFFNSGDRYEVRAHLDIARAYRNDLITDNCVQNNGRQWIVPFKFVSMCDVYVESDGLQESQYNMVHVLWFVTVVRAVASSFEVVRPEGVV